MIEPKEVKSKLVVFLFVCFIPQFVVAQTNDTLRYKGFCSPHGLFPKQ